MPTFPSDPIAAGVLMFAALSVWPAPLVQAPVAREQPAEAAVRREPLPEVPVRRERLSEAVKVEVVDRVLAALQRGYVFPEVATAIETSVRARVAAGAYAKIGDGETLARELTRDLQDVAHDKHLRVSFDPRSGAGGARAAGASGSEGPERNEDAQERRRVRSAHDNFGVERVERLAGNVGYLDLRGFVPPQLSGDTVAAAFDLLAHTDALIIDLRQNGGGSPHSVALVASYLFGPEPVHLNDIYDRPEDRLEEFWTLPEVPGKRYLGRDVFVLTSERTFSAAEEFAYDLQQLGRATLVGETTGGGANPGGTEPVGAGFTLFLPTGRAINPITKTNWEGTGVEPDIPTAAEDALRTAHLLALDASIATTEDPERRAALTEQRERVRRTAEATAR